MWTLLNKGARSFLMGADYPDNWGKYSVGGDKTRLPGY